MKTTIIALSGVVLVLAGCAETQDPWRNVRKPVAATPPACVDFQSSIYFEQDSSDLTKEARMVLSTAKSQARGCAVTLVRVVGLADAVTGTSNVNLALSQRRADAVSAALAKAGFAKVEIGKAAVGDAGAVAASGAAAPLRRRADILFDLEAPAR